MARREFGLAVRDWLPEQVIERARLLVSELVTNTVRHGGAGDEDEVVVVVRREADAVRVEVCQRAPVEAVRRTQREQDEVGGWGLQLVEVLADEWGIEDEPPCVWFRMTAE